MGTQAHIAEQDAISQAVEWTKRHRRAVLVVAGLVVLGGIVVANVITSRAAKAAAADRALRDAQAAAQAGNLPLATSDLSRLVSTYRGTPAAAEGAILLGQLRLTRGEADTAIRELRAFAESGPAPRFQAAAYNLLGAALEQTGRMAEAADAYAKAADRWPYDYLKAQSLLDAGRTYRAAGDTANGAQAYQRIVRDFAGSPSTLEARLRLAELRRGDAPVP